jgi:hypothetical protein
VTIPDAQVIAQREAVEQHSAARTELRATTLLKGRERSSENDDAFRAVLRRLFVMFEAVYSRTWPSEIPDTLESGRARTS